MKFKIFILLIAALSMNLFSKTSHRSADTIIVTPKMISQLNQIIADAQPYQTILFKKGVYTLKSGLYINHKSFLTLKAEENVFLILDEMNDIVISLYDSDNIQISGFHARHRDPVIAKEVCVGSVVHITDSHDIRLDRLELNGSGTEGVYISRSHSIYVGHSHIHHNTVVAIQLDHFVENIFFENNTFDHNPLTFKSNFIQPHEWRRFTRLKGNEFKIIYPQKTLP